MAPGVVIVGLVATLFGLVVAEAGASPSSGPDPEGLPCPGIRASSPATMSLALPPGPYPLCPGILVGSYLGGRSTDLAADVAVDLEGNIYVTGTTNSSDFPTTARYGPLSEIDSDAFLAKFNRTGSLLHSIRVGGSLGDSAGVVDIDPLGNVYVAGGTNSLDFPTTPDAHDPTHNGGTSDIFLVRFSPDGTLLHSTLLGASERDVAWSMALDPSGNVYLSGATTSPDFPVSPGSFASRGAGYDVFVAKFDGEGMTLEYSTVIGGTGLGQTAGWDGGFAIAVGRDGSAYVVGWTESPDFPTSQAFHTPMNGAGDPFVLMLTPDASALAYSRYLGGSEGWCEDAQSILVDPDGTAHILGDTCSADFATTEGAFDRTFNGAEDVYLADLSPSGDLLYATFLGGSGAEEGYGFFRDSFGATYLSGYTLSSDFPTTEGTFDATYNGHRDGYVMKLDPTRAFIEYATFLGGGDDILFDRDDWVANFPCNDSCGDVAFALAVDATGNVTLVGITNSLDFPTTDEAMLPTFHGDIDGFLVRMDLLPEPNRAPVAYFVVRGEAEDPVAVLVDANGSEDAEDTANLLEIRWDWEDDGVWDTGWSTTKVTSHDYAVGGTYTIRLEIRDTGGLTGQTTRTFVATGLNNVPSLNTIELSPSASTAGQAMTLLATLSDPDGDALSWTIDWGDGSISRGTTAPGGGSFRATHAYLAPGAYGITLTVADGRSGSAARTTWATVGAPLTVLAGVESALPPPPLTFAFTATTSGGTPPYSFLWDFGDGRTSLDQNPTHRYDTDGTYLWRLTVTDAAGRTATLPGILDIHGPTVVPWLLYSSAAIAATLAGLIFWRRSRGGRK